MIRFSENWAEKRGNDSEKIYVLRTFYGSDWIEIDGPYKSLFE
jgi:hypothetical protein